MSYRPPTRDELIAACEVAMRSDAATPEEMADELVSAGIYVRRDPKDMTLIERAMVYLGLQNQ